MRERCDEAELRELAEKLAWRPPGDERRVVNVFLDQNNKCNLRCRTCGFSDPRVASLPRYDLPRWLFDRIAAEVFPRARYVCLSLMTEPFMTRDFPDRLAACAEYGVPFSEVITNGTLITRRAAEKIVDAQLSRVIVSIDGGTKSVFEFLRPGARFEQVIANWRLLQETRRSRGAALPLLRINHVLSEPNIDVFDDFLALAESLEPDEIAVRTVSRMSDAEIQQAEDPAFWGKVREARGKLFAFCARTGIVDSAFLRDRPEEIELFAAGAALTCRAPWDVLAIHPNGDAYPCMAWSRPPIGNLARQTFDEIWSGDALASLRREFEVQKPHIDCLHCSIRKSADDVDDDFFFRKLAKPPAAERV